MINHLSSKWASSSTVTGELMLFPYDIRLDNLSEYKQWTLKDKDTADDVYTAIERPSVFRLRSEVSLLFFVNFLVFIIV